MVKIYVQNKPLFLVDTIDKETEDYLHRPETIFIDELNHSAVKTMLYELEQPEFYQGVFLHTDVDELLAAFKEHLNVIVAAGGLVYTVDKDLLLIPGQLSPPHGHLFTRFLNQTVHPLDRIIIGMVSLDVGHEVEAAGNIRLQPRVLGLQVRRGPVPAK